MEIFFISLLLFVSTTNIDKAVSSDFTYDYVGCYKDRVWPPSTRAMEHAKDMHRNATIERCTSICHLAGKRYAGLQFSYQCFCGNGGYNRYGKDSGGCNDRCGGNSAQICGDSRRNSVYRIIPTTTASTTSTSLATSTTTTHITASTDNKPVTATTQSTCATNRSGGNKTDSAPLKNLKQTTEPDSATMDLGTDIGAGVGTVAGCAALIIIVLIIVKRRAQLKNCRAVDKPLHNEIHSLAGPYTENSNNMEVETPHVVVNGEEYAVINKKSPSSHSMVITPADGDSEPSQCVEETYQNVQSATAVCYSTPRELGNWGYVTVPNGGYVTVPSYIATSRDEATTDTVVVENELYGT